MPPLLTELDEGVLELVISHPLQAWARRTVETLIEDLRACDSWADYADYQKLLFQVVWAQEQRRAEVRHAVKRLRRGAAVPDTTASPKTPGDPADLGTWKTEDLVLERVLRQLRSVGDALAWRASGFDRRYVVALAQNQSPGPMYGKDGIEFELGAVTDTWTREGRFCLLHDLTSCLRIGDLTEFADDGRKYIREIKRSPRRSPEQTRRMRAAVDAVNHGSPLPGTNEGLVSLDIDYCTHLAHLGDAVRLAQGEGVAAMRVPGGRALIASDLAHMARSSRFADMQEWVALTERRRGTVLRRAGMAEDRHHVSFRTADAAARRPSAVPYGVYPMLPAACAALICDITVVEIVGSVSSVLEAAAQAGLEPDLLLPDAHGELSPGQALFRLRDDRNGVIVHAGALAQLLAELIDLGTFVSGIAELLARAGDMPTSPILTFRHEDGVWW